VEVPGRDRDTDTEASTCHRYELEGLRPSCCRQPGNRRVRVRWIRWRFPHLSRRSRPGLVSYVAP